MLVSKLVANHTKGLFIQYNPISGDKLILHTYFKWTSSNKSHIFSFDYNTNLTKQKSKPTNMNRSTQLWCLSGLLSSKLHNYEHIYYKNKTLQDFK